MVKLFSKNSNLCDHNSPTLQTDRQTDRRTDRQTTCDRNTALCTKVHRAVKTIKQWSISETQMMGQQTFNFLSAVFTAVVYTQNVPYNVDRFLVDVLIRPLLIRLFDNDNNCLTHSTEIGHGPIYSYKWERRHSVSQLLFRHSSHQRTNHRSFLKFHEIPREMLKFPRQRASTACGKLWTLSGP